MDTIRRLLIPLAASFALVDTGTAAAGAVDYAREELWAQEIVPSIVVVDPVYLATPARAKVLAILTAPAGRAAGGIVIVHGLGVHPDWGLIGGLRSGLADAGYVTLAVQMPVLDANATRDDYASTLPEASERIAAAVAYLRGKGIAKIAPVRETAPARVPTLPKDACSRQLTIAGADHYFDRQQKELVAAIAAFLDLALSGRCPSG